MLSAERFTGTCKRLEQLQQHDFLQPEFAKRREVIIAHVLRDDSQMQPCVFFSIYFSGSRPTLQKPLSPRADKF